MGQTLVYSCSSANSRNLDQLARLDKILQHLKVVDSVVPGKVTVADISLLSTFVYFCDARARCEDVFKQNCPIGFAIVENLMKNSKIAELVEKAKKVPFLNLTLRKIK